MAASMLRAWWVCPQSPFLSEAERAPPPMCSNNAHKVPPGVPVCFQKLCPVARRPASAPHISEPYISV